MDSALLLKASLIDSVESISGILDGHEHSCSKITVGLCSNNPKTYTVFETASEIAKMIDELK